MFEWPSRIPRAVRSPACLLSWPCRIWRSPVAIRHHPRNHANGGHLAGSKVQRIDSARLSSSGSHQCAARDLPGTGGTDPLVPVSVRARILTRREPRFATRRSHLSKSPLNLCRTWRRRGKNTPRTSTLSDATMITARSGIYPPACPLTTGIDRQRKNENKPAEPMMIVAT
jgi:hypothetical protein